MTEKERRCCEVSDRNCTAPAGIGISGSGWAEGSGTARGTCKACGLAVCAQCSRIVTRRGVRRRECNNCMEVR